MSSRSVSVDTSGWAEPILQSTPHFVTRCVHTRGNYCPRVCTLVTSNYVLAELVALLTVRSRLDRTRSLDLIARIVCTPSLVIIHADESLDAAAWALLRRHPDTQWSLVDAASFEIVRQHGILEAFTSDHHFEQAGFVHVPT